MYSVDSVAQAFIVHEMPRRLRVRVPGRKHDIDYFTKVRDEYSQCPSVQTFEARPGTGSMVFYHTDNTESIISFAQERNLFAVLSHSDYVQTAVSSKKDASYPIEAITLTQPRAFDLQSPGILRLISLSLVGIGTLQILRGNFALPAWHAAFWYAYNLRAASQIQKPSA